MKNKFYRGIVVILVAAIFVSTGIVLKMMSNMEPSKETATDEEIEELLKEEEPPVVEYLEFTNAPEGYFNDALFIGDSRTVGLKMYAPIEGATYFASVGLDVYEIEEAVVEVDNVGSVTLTELLKGNKYGKVYIMLGINELGFDYDTNLVKYKKLMDTIRKYQPDAIIFVEANLRVGYGKSSTDSIINNANIDRFNEAISKFANNVDSVYIDVNPLFDDGYGNLNSEYTSDDVHLYANHYADWVNWFGTVAVMTDEMEAALEAAKEEAAKETAKEDASKSEENKENTDNDDKAE
ncbi:MAG: hypothetical protein IKU67_03330 [Firmicutes bacterium]|nr:hypothetical protein [Bacillota bacterium]